MLCLAAGCDQAPGTGLPHPSLEEGAGKRFSVLQLDVIKLQALVYHILLWRKVPESDARSVGCDAKAGFQREFSCEDPAGNVKRNACLFKTAAGQNYAV